MSAIAIPHTPSTLIERPTTTRRIGLRRRSTPVTEELGTVTHRPDGTVLARQGAPVKQILVVTSGQVELTATGPDGARVRRIGQVGTVIGEAGFDMDGAYLFTVVAHGDVSLLAYTPNTYPGRAA